MVTLRLRSPALGAAPATAVGAPEGAHVRAGADAAGIGGSVFAAAVRGAPEEARALVDGVAAGATALWDTGAGAERWTADLANVWIVPAGGALAALAAPQGGAK